MTTIRAILELAAQDVLMGCDTISREGLLASASPGMHGPWGTSALPVCSERAKHTGDGRKSC